MTLRITLTDDERAVLQAVADGRPLGKGRAGGSTAIPDGLPLDVARLAPRHRVVRDRARLLLLIDATHKIGDACRAVGRSIGWASAAYHAFRLGGLAALLALHPYEGRRRLKVGESLQTPPTHRAGLGRKRLCAPAPSPVPPVPEGQTNGDGPDQPESREAFVARMRRRGKTIAAIAEVLGVSPQRASQLVLRAKAEGHDVAPTGALYTYQTAATELGVGIARLTRLAHTLWPGDPVRCPRQGRRGAGHAGRTRLAGGRRLTADDVETLRSALELSAGRCSVCGAPLRPPAVGGRVKACPEHRAEQARRVRGTVGERKATPRNTVAGHIPHTALQALRGVDPDPSAGHCKIAEAASVSGLSVMQVHWLGDRRILATVPDPAGSLHKATGRPVRVYFRNQLTALAAVFAGSVGGGVQP